VSKHPLDYENPRTRAPKRSGFLFLLREVFGGIVGYVLIPTWIVGMVIGYLIHGC
jgi:hypothetical protein